MSNSDNWVESAAALPVAFAQVREDPRIDQRLLQEIGREARVLMIASGGETAALLATLPLRNLDLVDMNPAQISLTRLKLALLHDTSTTERLRLLGHTPMPPEQRGNELQRRMVAVGIQKDSLGPRQLIAELGPDYCGRYEWVFARLRELLGDHYQKLSELLSLSDPDRQSTCVDSGTRLGRALENTFADALELSKLIAIFGPDATANRVVSFAEHFLHQTRQALRWFPATENPFLHQILLGEFPGPIWDWMDLSPGLERCPVEFRVGAMEAVLTSLPDKNYDLIHLSNILDWIQPDQATTLLEQAFRCLSPGGMVVIRQLNSTLDIPAVPSGFHWNGDLGQELHRGDRSFFYRAIHVGTRR
jgi:S-adenosylmethionine-diacylglycerol 3-amino-3-carboxypropyl transferase